ncbi:hypothetical protein GCM10008015_25830 [Flavobacterium palustre]|uniref:3-keto-disaccharide hydrolase domain-containing protein n=1 Tax=Flavobacterium palustre TaxID=1476463 RepID=A0ABQ1HPN4_9FLAO|nr:hypothetical protein [Flavobacterium palustre]GGA83854.1 hypothetical protein GCM10008015_25830 [Flavobacterium palustre]
MKKKLLFLVVLLSVEASLAQTKKINLNMEVRKNRLFVLNRLVHPFVETKYKGLEINEKSGEGIVWLQDQNFSNGIIEIDMKGQDIFQKSFLGIAFHGQNDSIYEAVYFRPFNFHAQDSVRRIHAVQYIAHADFTWEKLRKERNAEFEKKIPNAPNPNEWFHARIEISATEVTVFVEKNLNPVLRVKRLSAFSDGKIGLFVGDNSGGKFANLKIIRFKN